MIPGDSGHCRPVDALRCDALRAIGRLLAETRFVARAGLHPQAVEYPPSLRIERLDRKHGNVAMLWVNPSERGRRRIREQEYADPQSCSHCLRVSADAAFEREKRIRQSVVERPLAEPQDITHELPSGLTWLRKII